MSSNPSPALGSPLLHLRQTQSPRPRLLSYVKRSLPPQMGQDPLFPVSELCGTPYFRSNVTHCSGDSLSLFTFIVTPSSGVVEVDA